MAYWGNPKDKKWSDLIWSGRYQEAWDYWLVYAWVYQQQMIPYHGMMRLVQMGAQLDGLKRLPPPYFKGRIQHFIGDYLPKLSDRMFAQKHPIRDETIWLIAGAVSRSNMDARPSIKRTRENRERVETAKQNMANKISTAVYMEWKEKLNSSLTRVHRASNAGRRR